VIAYVDTSVLLRVALRQRDALPEWREIDHGIASAIVMVEGLRTLDRLRRRANLPDRELASRRATLLRLIASVELIETDVTMVERAAQPMPTELGTLGAIHLASALLWKEMTQADLVMATHDDRLALAAQAHGLPVVGVSRRGS
jgi:predicted nucleic acid-binding protein